MTQDFFEELPFGWTPYANQTTLHPLAVACFAVMSVLMFLLPRRHALSPMLVLLCFIPTSQRVVLLGLDFTILRLAIIVGGLRILMRHEFRALRWQGPDTLMMVWAAVNLVVYTLLRGSMGALIYALGYVYQTVGLYLLIRCLVRTWTDVFDFAKTTVVIGLIVSIGFLNEKATGRNVFSIFGGVPEITVIRDDRLRCQGAFYHPILAGCFWAGMLPYFTALWWQRNRRGRLAASVGVACGLVIIITCASSTPVGAVVAGLFAAVLYPLRYRMLELRLGALVMLVSLHLVMKAPVWHLLARIDLVGGSTGWHRYYLVDQAIRRFPEWALLGTESTAHWGRGLSDVTCQYVLEGIQGGFAGLLLFVLMIWSVFRRVGLIWRDVTHDRTRTAMAWAMGAALWIHIVNFIAVAYFAQAAFLWCFAIAIPVSLSEGLERGRRRTQVAAPSTAESALS